jgi:hypothetical protein
MNKIICPHCGRKDCAVYAEDGVTIICSVTGEVIGGLHEETCVRDSRTSRR